MLSRNENQEARDSWKKFTPNIIQNASLDLDAILARLHISNPGLSSFLKGMQKDMLAKDTHSLDARIRQREISIKSESRAKLGRAGTYAPETWIGGRMLEYRFANAMTILRDIFAGLEGKC
jgi:hypothetical protein